MKVSPLAQGSGVPSQPLAETGRSYDKIAAAKAIAAGQRPDPTEDPQVKRAQSLQRIKMNTQRSTDRGLPPEEIVDPALVPAQENDTIDPNEKPPEETKQLSPQFAALARQKRALQVKESELAKREEALKTAPATNGRAEFLAQLKANPLEHFAEAGLSYEELAEIITKNPVSAEAGRIRELEAKLDALTKGVDTKLSDRDAQAEQQVLAQIERDVTSLVSQGDDYEMIRETKSVPDVKELIHRTFKETGEVLDTHEACRLIEEDLLNESLKITKLKKIQSQMAPQTQQLQVPQRQIRTLTNRDAAQPQLDRRTRALMAFEGRLKK